MRSGAQRFHATSARRSAATARFRCTRTTFTGASRPVVAPPSGEMPQDGADVGEESHVEHPIRLVEDQDLQVLELRVRLAEVVEEPPGRCDDHVDAAPERVLLRPHADAAEDRRAGERRVYGER